MAAVLCCTAAGHYALHFRALQVNLAFGLDCTEHCKFISTSLTILKLQVGMHGRCS